MTHCFGALVAARFRQVATVQGSSFLPIDSAMLGCDNETKFGAIGFGYDIRTRQTDPFVFISADLGITGGTKQVYLFGQALGTSRGGGGLHCRLEMPTVSECPIQIFC